TMLTGRPGGSGTDIRHDEYVRNYGFRVDINGLAGSPVSATGAEMVDSTSPCAGCGPNGVDYFDSEITSMDLQGSASWGPVHIRESPTRQSLGRTSQRTSGVDFPADSFFDIFVELDMPDGSTLHNEQP